MAWELQEAVGYYQKQGAPSDQSALMNLLLEVQQEMGGSVPKAALATLARILGVKDSFLIAFIRRMPRLRLDEGHLLELCAGPNCSKATELAKKADQLCAGTSVKLKFVPCMRLCGKGPNCRIDGTLYHKMTPDTLEKLLKSLN